MSFITPSFSSNLITPSFLWKKATGLSLSVLNPRLGLPFLCFLLSGFPAPYLETINGSELWQGPPVHDALPVRGCPGNPIPPPILGISWLACTMQSSCREPNDRGRQSSWAEGRCNAWLLVVRPWTYITPWDDTSRGKASHGRTRTPV